MQTEDKSRFSIAKLKGDLDTGKENLSKRALNDVCAYEIL